MAKYYSTRAPKREEKKIILGELLACIVFMAGVLALGAMYYVIWPGYY